MLFLRCVSLTYVHLKVIRAGKLSTTMFLKDGRAATLLGASKCFENIKENAASLFLLTLLRVRTHPSSSGSSYFANPPHFLHKMHKYLILLLIVFYLFTDYPTHIHTFLYLHLLPTHKLHGKACLGFVHLSAS